MKEITKHTVVILFLCGLCLNVVSYSQTSIISLDSAKVICNRKINKPGQRIFRLNYAEVDTIKNKPCWKLEYQSIVRHIKSGRLSGWTLYAHRDLWIDQRSGKILKQIKSRIPHSPIRPTY